MTIPSRLPCCLLLTIVLMTAATAEAAGPRGQTHAGYHGRTVDRDWNGHAGRAHRYWNQPYFQPEPAVVYAPPVVYSAPPAYEEPGFSLIMPLHIR